MPPPRRATAALVLAVAVAVAAATTACADSSGPGSATTSTTAPAGPAGAEPTPSRFGPGVLRGTIVDDDVTESSGLVASRRNPGRLWTHNDSDNPPVVFCVEPDGRSCGGWTVDGAGNVDWEDIAAGPGPQPGEHYLYVGDIGDNTRSRDDVVVYRVVEPTVGDAPADPGTTVPATALRFRFDDGPHDAESLMVHPGTGDVYVVAKQFGDAGVYRGPPGGGVLSRIATAGLGPFAVATGADISPDGRRVAICTPGGGFELTLEAGEASDAGEAGAVAADFEAIWASAPVAVALPARKQGESIAYRLDGDALLVTSEGYPSPLFEVPRL